MIHLGLSNLSFHPHFFSLITPCRRKLVKTKLTRKARQLTSLSLGFLIHQMGMIILGCLVD